MVDDGREREGDEKQKQKPNINKPYIDTYIVLCIIVCMDECIYDSYHWK